MTAHNRYLSGDLNTMIAPVRGNVAVEAGDLMFIHNTDASLGETSPAWTADNKAYPFSSLACTGANAAEGIIAKAFLGVAMESSLSGVTENITIAQGGEFRFNMNPFGGVTLGMIVSACTQPSIGCSNQAVSGASDDTNSALGNMPGSTGFLGYCVKTSESGATFVDVRIQTTFGYSGVVPQIA